MKLHLLSKKDEAPGVESLIFKPAEKVAWKPGQFFHYVLHHEPTDDRGSDRWFTVASAPSEDVIMITTRFTKDTGSSFKKALGNLKVGENIEIADIDGDFIVEDLTKEYVFIAGGIGITPFRSILKELDHSGKKIAATLLYSNRDDNVPYKSELEAFAKNNPDLRIHYVIGGRIDEAKIRGLVPDLHKPVFYVSGPEPMVDAFNKMLKEMGVSEQNLKGDWFPGYPAE